MSMKKIKRLQRENHQLREMVGRRDYWLKYHEKDIIRHRKNIERKDAKIADYENTLYNIKIVDNSYKELYHKTKSELDKLQNRNVFRRILNR